MLRVISLGAGVQSTTMALMAAHGEIGPMPDAAVFADTQAEPFKVYEHLKWMKGGNALPFPVYVATAGSLTDQIFRASAGSGRNDGRPPFFVKNPDGTRGMLSRQCTHDFKLIPIHKQVRQLLGLQPGQSIRSLSAVKELGLKRRDRVPPVVEQWIGISLDEAIRMKPAKHSWVRNRFPLLEINMTRSDCEDWLRQHDYPIPPKSACVYCPFKSDAEWVWLRDNDPEGFALAVQIDKALRSVGYVGLVGEGYLHESLKPLDEVEFKPKAKRKRWHQTNMFLNECEGMCGV